MIKKIFVLFIISIISGCSNIWLKTNGSLNVPYEPIANIDNTDGESYLGIAIETLNNSGYSSDPNYVFYTATTLPKNLGKQRWRRNGDKWDINYQLGIQIIKGSNGQLYWKLSHNITGTRSGKEPRSFQASDFDITEELTNDIHRKLSLSFTSRA